MPLQRFDELAEGWISTAKEDAARMGIHLGPDRDNVSNKVRRIVTFSGFTFSETERHVVVAVRIAAFAYAMMGVEPTQSNIRYSIRK